MSDDALPMTTEMREAHIHGAEKYAQIGTEASWVLLQSIMTGANLSNVAGVMVLDLYLKVGDFLRAFAFNRAMFNCPTFFIGICETQVEKDWVTADMIDTLAEKIKNHEMCLPNGEKLKTEMPADMVEPMPPAPNTNKLVITGDTLVLPVSIVKQWQFHPMFGLQFVAWMDEFVAKGNKFSVASSEPDDKSPGKRSPVTSAPESPPKKAKVAAELIV